METLTETEFEEILSDAPLPAEKEELSPARRFGSAPPKRGACRRCGQDRPINRMMLCYACWVKTVLEEKAGWREGLPHPEWCLCSLPGHVRKSDGN